MVKPDPEKKEELSLWFKVYDHDVAVSNDFLGKCNINVEKCVKDPNEWVINKYFKLWLSEKEKSNVKFKNDDNDCGELYVQIKFVPKEI